MNKEPRAKGVVSGVITIEAAIILPLVLISIIGLLYFVKVIYIQDQIHSAMTRTAHEMATYSSIADRSELVDLQQEVYLNGGQAIGKVKTSYGDVIGQGGQIKSNVKGVTDLAIDTADLFKGLDLLGGSGKVSFFEFAQQASSLVISLPGMIEKTQGQITGLIEGVGSLVEEATAGLVGVGSMELVDYVNGVLAMKMVEGKFHDYITKDQLAAWFVKPSGSATSYGIDFSDSQYMVEDDSIQLVGRYIIGMPLLSRFIDGIPVYQTVRARAFTGTYDYNSKKRSFPKQQPVEDQGQIFYVSTKEGVECYHVYTCLCKELKSGLMLDRVSNHKQEVCKYCGDHYNLSTTNIVYYVSERSKLHFTKECPKVTSSSIRALTKEEAEAGGYRKCKKNGCTHGLLGSQ